MKNLFQLMAFLVVCYCGTESAASTWNHDLDNQNGPAHWGDSYPSCNDKKQSPIHLRTSEAVYNSDLGSFKLYHYDSAISSLELENNGHTAQVQIEHVKPKISGAGLGHEYILQQFHFHWGKDNKRGSEHLLDDEAIAGEAHFVHYREDLNSSTVLNVSNGIAVLGVLLKAGGHKHPGYQKVLNSLGKITNKGDHVKLSSFPLRELFPSDIERFYRYNGSLTTPPCSEAVVWTVFKEFITLSDDQMAGFRRLQGSGASLLNTYRPVTPINERKLYTSWIPNNSTSAGTGQRASWITLFCVAFPSFLMYKRM